MREQNVERGVRLGKRSRRGLDVVGLDELHPPGALNAPDLLDIGEGPGKALPHVLVVGAEQAHQRVLVTGTENELEQRRIQRVHDDLRNRIARLPG